jgi:hypothetical protein
LEELKDEDMRKNQVKLEGVLGKEIVKLQNMPMEAFFTWKWEDSENPLKTSNSKEPLTQKFADAGKDPLPAPPLNPNLQDLARTSSPSAPLGK